ncbi:MAG: MopE-related protein [Polyangiales bacterium]
MPLPFPFRFYGAAYTSVGLSSNGVMGFPSTTGDFDNHSLPYAPLGNAIMPFWDDLRQRTGVCVATFGAAPDRLFVAQWSEADLEDRGTTNNVGARLNFEVVLEESSQAVSVIYGAMEGDSRVTGSSATIGVQRADGMAFDQVSHDTAGAVVSGSSIRWMPPIAGTCNNGGMCQACATTETCDGLDNNCNALVDDGIPDISCGVGACRRTAPGCVHGAAGTCTPGSPTPEVCNHIDDNCNGTVDEGCTGTLSCPSDTTIFAGNAVSLSAVTTGNVTNLLWDIVSGPTGGPSVVGWSPTTRNAVTENITPIIVGVYRVQITGVDGYGSPLSCAFNLTAQTRGLRVQLTWDGAGDLDVHLHNSNNTPWYTADDTYYGRMSSPWGATLDVDNVTANGPENIRMNSPAVGSTYTVAVHHYANGAGRRATIQIFCGLSGSPPSRPT